jgi:hypothetical protein
MQAHRERAKRKKGKETSGKVRIDQVNARDTRRMKARSEALTTIQPAKRLANGWLLA